MKLHDLRPKPGAKHRKKRVGRGISAGGGKTAGRGTKGQKARAGGGVPPWHEGGNLPLVRRMPLKRGFKPPFQVEYYEVNVEKLNIFPEGAEVTPEALVAHGLVKNLKRPVVILGRGELKVALKVKAHRVSQGARAKIEAAGGSVELLPLK